MTEPFATVTIHNASLSLSWLSNSAKLQAKTYWAEVREPFDPAAPPTVRLFRASSDAPGKLSCDRHQDGDHREEPGKHPTTPPPVQQHQATINGREVSSATELPPNRLARLASILRLS